MQGPFTLSEPVANKRVLKYLLVDATDHATPETGEAGGQPQIQKPGETTWTNADGLLVHTGNGHYISTLGISEIDSTGGYSFRYKSAETDEFQDTFRVSASSSDVSLDEVTAKLDDLEIRLRHIEFLVSKVDRNIEVNPFVSPL